jgi:hypothetical protein
MDILKSISKPNDTPKHPNTGRRSFMWKIGAAMSAVLAFAVPAMSRPRTNNDTNLKVKVDRLSNQLRILEDESAIHRLHQTYENLLNNGRYKEVVDLFTDDGEVVYNGGVFKGRKSGVRRLYCDHFMSGLTGRRIEPAPGFQPDIEQQEDMVEVTADRKSGRARFTYSIQVGAPIISDSILVKMARLHGEGIIKWWEGGIYEVSYVKDIKEGSWKIKRLEYRVLSKADYRPGRSLARPILTPLFSKAYPEDPAGPDKLIHPAQGLRKA